MPKQLCLHVTIICSQLVRYDRWLAVLILHVFYIILWKRLPSFYLRHSHIHPAVWVWSSINNDLYPNTTLNQYQLNVKICLSLRPDICLIYLCTVDSTVANGTHRKRSRLVVLNFFLGSCLKKSAAWKL